MENSNLAHIMVVDDDNIDIESLLRALKKNNIPNHVQIAHDGVEAWEILSNNTLQEGASPIPDILLLDINMPRMNGLELLDKIRKHDSLKSIIVFVLTTSDDDSDILEAYNLNVAGYILKPNEFNDFIRSIAILEQYLSLIQYPNKTMQ